MTFMDSGGNSRSLLAVRFHRVPPKCPLQWVGQQENSLPLPALCPGSHGGRCPRNPLCVSWLQTPGWRTKKCVDLALLTSSGKWHLRLFCSLWRSYWGRLPGQGRGFCRDRVPLGHLWDCPLGLLCSSVFFLSNDMLCFPKWNDYLEITIYCIHIC